MDRRKPGRSEMDLEHGGVWFVGSVCVRYIREFVPPPHHRFRRQCLQGGALSWNDPQQFSDENGNENPGWLVKS